MREAGSVLMKYWHAPREIRRKGRIDLVTTADFAVEKILKARLGEILPEAAFMAEESVSSADLARPLNGPTWIIDPLDGTTNFAHGFPFVAISVALWDQEQVHLGFVHLPVLGELFQAVLDGGARLNGEVIAVSRILEVEDSLVATGFPYTVRDHLPSILTWMEIMLAKTQGIRRAGSAAVDLAYTAAGRFDAFYEIQLKPWDTAAGWLLVTEAGGRVSRMDGNPFTPQAPSILASNGLIHKDLVALLADKA
jgi:myo-inositol-1(or 4)-monophosphatase